MRRKLLKNVRKITLECILAVASVTMLTACGSDAKPSDSQVTTENNQQSVTGGGSGEQTVTGSDSTGQTENADEEEAKHADIAKVVEDFLKNAELRNYEEAKNTWFPAAWEYNDKYVYVNNNDDEIVDILSKEFKNISGETHPYQIKEVISDAVFSDIDHMLTYDIFWMDTFVRPDNQACVIVDVTLNDTSVKTRFYLVHAEDKWSICSIESSDLKEMVVDMYNSIYGNVETIGGESAASISMDDINKGIANNVYTTKNQCEGEVFDAVDFSIVLPERWSGEIGTDNFGQGRSCVELKLGADEIITIIEANIWDYENEKQVFDVYNTIEEYLYHQVKEYCSFAGYGIQNITTGCVAGLHQEMYAITWQMVSGSDIEPHIDDYAAIYFEANGKIYCANVDAIHSGRFSSSTYTRLLEVIGTIEAK